jgi:hypothetical protein
MNENVNSVFKMSPSDQVYKFTTARLPKIFNNFVLVRDGEKMYRELTGNLGRFMC